MNTADIHWIQLPPANGHEQTGRRPAIILQDEAYGGSLPTVLTIPLTSVMSALRFPGTLRIESSAANGLSRASVALIFQLRASDRRRIQEKIGTLERQDLASIYAALDRLMGRQGVQ